MGENLELLRVLFPGFKIKQSLIFVFNLQKGSDFTPITGTIK